MAGDHTPDSDPALTHPQPIPQEHKSGYICIIYVLRKQMTDNHRRGNSESRLVVPDTEWTEGGFPIRRRCAPRWDNILPFQVTVQRAIRLEWLSIGQEAIR